MTKRVAEMAAQISEVYGDEPICLICILKGSVFFTVELAKRMKNNVQFEFIEVSS